MLLRIIEAMTYDVKSFQNMDSFWKKKGLNEHLQLLVIKGK